MFFTVKLATTRFFQGDEIRFDFIITNRGEGYDNYSRFITPVNGTYFFIVTIANEYDNTDVQASLVVNSIAQTKAQANGREQFQTGL